MSAAGAVRPPSGGTSDEELMRRVQLDDAEAFEALYDRHSVRAYRVARAACGGSEAAEEAVQEGFISIWRSRGAYRPNRGGVTAWAMTVVRNRAIDAARRNAAHDIRRAEAEALERQPAAGDLVDDAITDDHAQHLRTRLTGLPDAQREVIALAYFGELTHTEIADHLGIPSGTVKGRMRLGLEKLRLNLA